MPTKFLTIEEFQDALSDRLSALKLSLEAFLWFRRRTNLISYDENGDVVVTYDETDQGMQKDLNQLMENLFEVLEDGIVNSPEYYGKSPRHQSTTQQQIDEVIQHALREYQASITGLSALNESLIPSLEAKSLRLASLRTLGRVVRLLPFYPSKCSQEDPWCVRQYFPGTTTSLGTGGLLWPSSYILAHTIYQREYPFILPEPVPGQSLRVLEVGCGAAALPSLVLLRRSVEDMMKVQPYGSTATVDLDSTHTRESDLPDANINTVSNADAADVDTDNHSDVGSHQQCRLDVWFTDYLPEVVTFAHRHIKNNIFNGLNPQNKIPEFVNISENSHLSGNTSSVNPKNIGNNLSSPPESVVSENVVNSISFNGSRACGALLNWLTYSAATVEHYKHLLTPLIASANGTSSALSASSSTSTRIGTAAITEVEQKKEDDDEDEADEEGEEDDDHEEVVCVCEECVSRTLTRSVQQLHKRVQALQTQREPTTTSTSTSISTSTTGTNTTFTSAPPHTPLSPSISVSTSIPTHPESTNNQFSVLLCADVIYDAWHALAIPAVVARMLGRRSSLQCACRGRDKDRTRMEITTVTAETTESASSRTSTACDTGAGVGISSESLFTCPHEPRVFVSIGNVKRLQGGASLIEVFIREMRRFGIFPVFEVKPSSGSPERTFVFTRKQ